jgi:hypothetical protein
MLSLPFLLYDGIRAADLQGLTAAMQLSISAACHKHFGPAARTYVAFAKLICHSFDLGASLPLQPAPSALRRSRRSSLPIRLCGRASVNTTSSGFL